MWSRVDEAAHYDVIAQYAAGVYPRDSVTTIRPETLEIMEKTGVYGFVVDNAYQRPGGFAKMPGGLNDAEHVLWIRRHGWQYSYEAFQPPLYYALALPAWKLGDLIGGPFGALYAVRIFDALLAATLAPLAMLIALRVWPTEPQVGWAAAVLTAAMPGVDVNLTSVTNDVLVSVLGAITVLVALTGRVTFRRAALVGALLGTAFLAKTTAVALVPAVVVVLGWDRNRWSRAAVALAVTVAGLIAAAWLVSNLAIYGELITTREQTAMSAFPARTATVDFWSLSTLHAFVTFWTGDPFLSLPFAVPLAVLAAVIMALAIAGLVRAERSRALAAVILAAAGAALVSVTSPVLAAFDAPGRLAYVAVTAATALVAVGLWHELRSFRLRAGVAGMFAAVSLAGVAASSVAPFLATAPAGPRAPAGAVKQTRLVDATGTFRGVRINVLACVVDRSGDLWLDFGIVNYNDTPAEWSQTAEIHSGGETISTSDYRRSTPLGMTVPNNASGGGWLFFGPASRLSRLASPSVVFRNIAVRNYTAVGDLVIPTALC